MAPKSRTETSEPQAAPLPAAAPESTPAEAGATTGQDAQPTLADLLSAPGEGPDVSELDDAIPALWIRSVTPSFRRCGFTFTREGHGIALSALTEDQVEVLMNEPNLVVEHTCFTDPVQE